jgi:hypothetical protein
MLRPLENRRLSNPLAPKRSASEIRPPRNRTHDWTPDPRQFLIHANSVTVSVTVIWTTCRPAIEKTARRQHPARVHENRRFRVRDQAVANAAAITGV